MSARWPKFTIYYDGGGEWRWRLQASNGRIVADGGEGYTTLRGALRAVERLQILMDDAVDLVVER